MRNLEEITRDLFFRYSIRKIGRKSHWHKLSKHRKLDWLEDSFLMLDELADLLEKEFSLDLPMKNPNASYEVGVLHGMQREQLKLKNKIKSIRSKYADELLDLISKLK